MSLTSASPDYWKISIEEELLRNDKLKQQDINSLRDWLEKQSHLPQNITDNQLVLFLHAANYRLSESKVLMENYYTLRTKLTPLFGGRNPLHPYIQQIISVSACVVHGKDNMNRNVVWTKLLDTEPTKYYPTTATKVTFMITDIDQLENGVVPGYTMVLDGKNFGVKHALRCSFTNARNIISYVQTASTIVIEKVLMVNMTPAAEKVMMLLKPFIYSDLFKKITVCPHGTYDELFKAIPKESIPTDYNGVAPSIETLNEIWRRKLELYADWFAEEEKQRLNDPKRIANATTIENSKNEIPDDSFKMLAID